MYIKAESRAKIGEQMDKYLRDNIDDEEVFCDVWLTYGMPDDASDDDYESLIEDDEFWLDCLETFVKTVLLDAEME